MILDCLLDQLVNSVSLRQKSNMLNTSGKIETVTSFLKTAELFYVDIVIRQEYMSPGT